METIVQHETLKSLQELLLLDESSEGMNRLAQTDHRYLRDLKVNVSNALSYATLSKKESLLLALATAINEKQKTLIASFQKLATASGATEQEIAETYACVSLLNANNVFYRFRHFTKKEFYEKTPAGIKMTIMANPVLGKEFFELMSLAVSALNGCELCVNAHEESLLKLNSPEQRIFDSIRLAAVIRSLCTVL